MNENDYTADMLPLVWPNAANVRTTDPTESHHAADVAVGRVPTKLAVERALVAAGHPVTADEVYRIARFDLGFRCTPQRVRTVLSEYSPGGKMVDRGHPVSFETVGVGKSDFDNDARLWKLA